MRIALRPPRYSSVTTTHTKSFVLFTGWFFYKYENNWGLELTLLGFSITFYNNKKENV
jgi:hypothetical protein